MAVTVASVVSAPAGAGPITTAGGDEILWAYRVQSDEATGTEVVKFAYLPARVGAERFRPLPMTPVGGNIERSAVRGRNLHLFFADGTHYRLHPPVSATRRGDRSDSPELKLPDSQVPIVLCGDDQTDVLFAVVPTGIAEKLEAAIEASPASQPVGDANEGAAGTHSRPSDQTPETGLVDRPGGQPTRFALVRYAAGRWEQVSPIPAFFDEQTACRLTAYAGACHLFFTSVRAEQVLRQATYDGRTWTDPQAVPGVSPEDLLCALAQEDRTVLVVREPGRMADAFRIRAFVSTDGQWTKQQRLVRDGADLACRSDEVAVGRFKDQLAVALSDEAGGVLVGLWPFEGGPPTVAPRTEVALAPAPERLIGERTRMVIAFLFLTALLMIVFARRRKSFLVDLPTPPGYSRAGLGRRFVAAAVDLMIALPVVYPVLNPWFVAHFDSAGRLGDQWMLARNYYGDELYWRWLAAVGLYALYGILFEATLTATPGKLIMQLRVCNDRGERCSLQAVVLRNVLRVVEYYPMMQLFPTLILIVLTRNRQRIGDLLARTIVVEKIRMKDEG